MADTNSEARSVFMKRYNINSIALMAVLAALTSFAAGCYYDGYDRSDYARRGDRYNRADDRYYDRRDDWRYGRYDDNRYPRRSGDRDRNND